MEACFFRGKQGAGSQADIDRAKIYIEITNETITFYERGKKKESPKYTFNADKSPHELQLTYGKDKINHAIFSISKGTLTICTSNKYRPNSPEDRPDGFDSSSERNATLGGLYVDKFTLEKP